MRQQPVIQIVDDSKVNLALLEAVLKGEGYSVLSVQDANAAYEVAAAQLPDLILLDIMMPDIDGFEVCKQLKQDAATTDIPVIFVSAKDDVESKVTGFDIGAVDYITKPFEKVEILARVRIHLKLSMSAKALAAEQSEKLKSIHDAQQAILVQPDEIQGANFGVCYRPMHEVGGDFYDVKNIGQDIFGYFVADTSGHDLKASFVTPALKALVGENVNPVYTLVETMKHINSVLNNMLTDGKHVTASYAKLYRKKGLLEVINAGHPPIIFLAENGRPQSLDINGDVLGAFESVCFEPNCRQVAPGDRFFMYSDGLIETDGNSLEERKEGIKKLCEYCYQRREEPVQQAVDNICKDILGDDSEYKDDIVLLGVQV